MIGMSDSSGISMGVSVSTVVGISETPRMYRLKKPVKPVAKKLNTMPQMDWLASILSVSRPISSPISTPMTTDAPTPATTPPP